MFSTGDGDSAFWAGLRPEGMVCKVTMQSSEVWAAKLTLVRLAAGKSAWLCTPQCHTPASVIRRFYPLLRILLLCWAKQAIEIWQERFSFMKKRPPEASNAEKCSFWLCFLKHPNCLAETCARKLGLRQASGMASFRQNCYFGKVVHNEDVF